MSKNRRTEKTKTHNTVPGASGKWQQYSETTVKDNRTGKTGRGTGKTAKQSRGRANKDLREK